MRSRSSAASLMGWRSCGGLLLIAALAVPQHGPKSCRCVSRWPNHSLLHSTTRRSIETPISAQTLSESMRCRARGGGSDRQIGSMWDRLHQRGTLCPLALHCLFNRQCVCRLNLCGSAKCRTWGAAVDMGCMGLAGLLLKTSVRSATGIFVSIFCSASIIKKSYRMQNLPMNFQRCWKMGIGLRQ